MREKYEYYKEREDLSEWLKERKREAFQDYINSLEEKDGEKGEGDPPTERD